VKSTTAALSKSLRQSQKWIGNLLEKCWDRRYLKGKELESVSTGGYLGMSLLKGLWNPVFKEWARSWCKRSVVQSAIRLIFSECVQFQVREAWPESSVSSAINGVTRLAPLTQFVLVMSVLERYSDRECSLLLSCTEQLRPAAFDELAQPLNLVGTRTGR
jgi:hypothetical protein